jgi:hypothetical protein
MLLILQEFNTSIKIVLKHKKKRKLFEHKISSFLLKIFLQH